MPEDERPEGQEEDLRERFPALPPRRELPEVPDLDVPLPPHPSKPKPGSIEPGSYGKAAIAFTAASSFTMPIIVMSVGGWWIDGKFKTAPWGVFIGVVVGFAAGISSLLNVIKKLSE
jgi:hypothetical protein